MGLDGYGGGPGTDLEGLGGMKGMGDGYGGSGVCEESLGLGWRA